MVVQGDLYQPKLGLTQTDEDLLVQRVDIVIHSAATIKFNEKLKLAIETNIAATKQLCRLAHEMVKVKVTVALADILELGHFVLVVEVWLDKMTESLILKPTLQGRWKLTSCSQLPNIFESFNILAKIGKVPHFLPFSL